MGIFDKLMGTPVPPAQMQAGGIPQNADPGKGVLTGRQLSGKPPAPSLKPSPVALNDTSGGAPPPPAQLLPQAPPTSGLATPPPAMGMMPTAMAPPQINPQTGQPPPTTASPQMLQALQQMLAQRQAGGMAQQQAAGAPLPAGGGLY